MVELKIPTILGSFRGKIGDYVVYMHRNRRCIRRRPTGINQTPSPGQVAQQERMAAIAIFYQALKEAGIYPYWQKASEGMIQTGYNLLVKNNLPAFSGEGRICDFSKILITMGKLPLPDELKLERGEDGEWLLSWTNTPHSYGGAEDDRLMIVVMKDYETFDVERLDVGECCRKDCRAVFRLPDQLNDYTHMYVFFCSRTDGKSSKSRYFNINLNFECHGYL